MRTASRIRLVFEQRELVRRHLPGMRAAVILGVLFFALFGVFDVLLFPQLYRRLLLLRLLSLPLFSLIVFPLTYHSRFALFGPWLVSAVLVAGGMALGLMQISTPAPAHYVYFAGILVLLYYCYSLLGLPLLPAFVAGTLVTIAHCTLVMVAGSEPVGEKWAQLFIVVSVNIMGAFALRRTSQLERVEARAKHLTRIQHSQIVQARDELEERVLERTRDLHAMNHHLNETLETVGDQREVLESQLAERTILIQEVHHRVRNNLQAVLSLFELEKNHGYSPELARMEERVRAMAVVHGLMHDENDPSAVRLLPLCEQVCLRASMDGAGEPTSVRVQGVVFAEDVRVRLDDAVPCAMLLAELSLSCDSVRVQRSLDSGPVGAQLVFRLTGAMGGDDAPLARHDLVHALAEQIGGSIVSLRDEEGGGVQLAIHDLSMRERRPRAEVYP